MTIDLRQERINRGLSIRAIAQEIGVTPGVIRGAEDGQTPHPGNALKIATYFGQKVTDIWPVDRSAAA